MKDIFIEEYSVNIPLKNNSKDTHTMRIALVSDLHDRNPDAVIKGLKKIKPELILVAGDTFERNEEGYEGHTMEEIDSYQELSPLWSAFCNCLKLIRKAIYAIGGRKKENYHFGYQFIIQASKIAPIVIGIGNHEWYLLPKDIKLLNKYKVNVVDNSDIEYQWNGRKIRIGGLSTKHDTEWLSEFAQKDGIKILLSHHPEYYERFIKKCYSDTFALICSGHAHGGQWRLLGKGILAPGQGLFPKYHHGQYGKDGRFIISSGASNTSFIPRFGNPCEICLIHLNFK